MLLYILTYIPAAFMLYYLFHWLKISGRDKDVLKYGTQNSVAVIVGLNQEETSDKLKQKIISKQSVVYDVLVDEKTPAFFAVPTSEQILSGDSFIGSYYNGTNMFVTSDFAKKNVADLKKKFLIFLLVMILGAILQTAITHLISDQKSYNDNYITSQPHIKSDINEPWKTVNLQGISYTVPEGFIDKYPDDSIIDSYQQDDIGMTVILAPIEGLTAQQAYEIFTDSNEIKSTEILSTDPINGMDHIYYSMTNVKQYDSKDLAAFGRAYSVPGGACVITYMAINPDDLNELEKIATSIKSDGTTITAPPGYWEKHQ